MDKEQLVKLVREKGVDYTQHLYLMGFFVAFILLIIFVVRPTLNGYVVRQKELEDTIALSERYQTAIENLTKLQEVLEVRRDEFVYLEQAMPFGVHVHQLSQDMTSTLLEFTQSKSYTFPKYVVSNDTASENKKISHPTTYPLTIEIEGDFETLRGLLNDTLNQRRLKSIKSVIFSKNESSAGAKMKMGLQIEAYYL